MCGARNTLATSSGRGSMEATGWAVWRLITITIGLQCARASTVAAVIDNGVVSGRVAFTDTCGGDGVIANIDLHYTDGTMFFTEGHLWHVHTLGEPPTASRSSQRVCRWAGGHWDPEGVESPTYACNRLQPAGCYRGDMSGKLGTLSIDGSSLSLGGVNSNANKFSDPDVTIASTAALLGRSVVIHGANFSSTPLACAGIYPDIASFPAEDQQLVERFYAAVDEKDFEALRRITAVNYEAFFAPGCAVVGGAFHEGEEILGYEGLRELLDGADANDAGGTRRSFISQGSGVVLNHYDIQRGEKRIHGAAVHTTQDGRVVSSFWYGGSDACSGPHSMSERWEMESGAVGNKSAAFFLLVLVFVAVGISLDGWLQQRGALYLPGASVTMLLGVVCGASLRAIGDEKLEEVLEFDAELFVIVLLPLIIFEAGYALDKVGFFSNLLPICTFAILGTLLSTILIAPVVYFAAVRNESPSARITLAHTHTYTHTHTHTERLLATHQAYCIALRLLFSRDLTWCVCAVRHSVFPLHRMRTSSIQLSHILRRWRSRP